MKDAGCDPIGSDMEQDYDDSEAEAGRTADLPCGNATLQYVVMPCFSTMSCSAMIPCFKQLQAK